MKTIGFLIGVLLIAAAIVMALFVPAAWFSEPKSGAPNLTISIAASSTAATVADQLVEKGILTTTMGYRLYAMIDAAANKPRAGSYTVQPGMSYRVIAKKIASGPQRDEVSVKVIEGWSLMDEANMLKDMGVTLEKPLVSDYESDYPFLAGLPKGVTLEGYLFPDTYRVWKDQLPEGLIKKQLDEFTKKTDDFGTELKKQGRSMNDVVTLASIVQKEVADKSEMKTVAGIFWNRLKIGMPLQSDATVNYITHAGNTRPTAKELKSESPYNTYLNKGLPPGPISNPGADALEAALFPEKSSYLYFLTDANGKLYLAKTLDEHIRNRNKAFGE
jgi:UPF0755 protein